MSLDFLLLRELLECSVDPAACVLCQAGLGLSQVPVYDARCILAGTAVVEILASSIKVAPVR